MNPASVTEELVITREFDAPRDLVFRAFTEADRLAQWWGPKGFQMVSATVDLRPGGMFLYGMRSAAGMEMWGRWVFREVEPPEMFSFVASFSNPGGGVTRAPFAEDWPLEWLTIISFAEKGGRTALTMRAYPVNATEAERRKFHEGHGSMRQGFGGTLDQLDAYLAKEQVR